jgi:hypothetical protein
VSKSSVVLGVSLAALFCSLVVTVAFSQATDSLYEFERGFPAAGTTERAYDAADLRRAIEAYKFFYPTVATEAVIQQGLAAGAKANEIGIGWRTASLSTPTPVGSAFLRKRPAPRWRR